MKKSLLLAAGMFAFAAAAQETTAPAFVAEALDGKTITLQCASGENQPCNEYFLVVNGTSLAGAADHGSNPYKWLVEYDATEQGVILSAGGYYIGRVPNVYNGNGKYFTLTQDKELAGRYRLYLNTENGPDKYCLTATKFVNGSANASIGTLDAAGNTAAIQWMQCTTDGIARWASRATSSKWTYSVVEPDPVVEPEPQYTPEPGSYIRIGASTAGYYYDMTPGGNPCFSQDVNTAIYYYDANKRLVHYGEGRAAKASETYAHELSGSTTAADNADLNANAPEISFVACTDATVAGRYFVTWAYQAKNALLYCDQNGAICRGSAVDADLQGLASDQNWTFSIEDVTELPVKIGADGKGTMIVPVAVTVPASDDFTFYTASTNAEDKLVFSAVNAGATIPANTNIVIKRASTCTDEKCNVAIATNAAEAAATLAETSERFIGSYLATTAPAPAEGEVIYVKSSTLGESETAGENDVVFSKVAEGDVIPAGALAFKAKKNSEAEAPATLTLNLNAPNSGTTTAINSIFVENEPANGTIYDLQGRRLSAPVKGINIIGGRKVLVK